LGGTEFTADTTFVQKRVGGTCSVGSSIRAIAEDGTVTCESDSQLSSSQVTSMVSAAGYVTGGHTIDTDTLADLNCSTDDTIQWNGNAWVCVEASSSSGSTASSIEGKPFLGRSVSLQNWQSSFQSVYIEPLKPGNHLTPTHIKLEGKTSTSSYYTYIDLIFHYADNSSYTTSYSTKSTGWTTLFEGDIPIHDSLRGAVSQLEMKVRNQYNHSSYYSNGILTVSGHESSPDGVDDDGNGNTDGGPK